MSEIKITKVGKDQPLSLWEEIEKTISRNKLKIKHLSF